MTNYTTAIFYTIETTLLLSPWLGHRYAKGKSSAKWPPAQLLLAFIPFNICQLLGYSFTGDVGDVIYWAVEYFAICAWLFALRWKLPAGIIKALGLAAITTGYILGTIGFLALMVLCNTLQIEQEVKHNINGQCIATRIYYYSSNSSVQDRYDYDTYRQFNYLPFEHKLDATTLWTNKNDVDPADSMFKFVISADSIIFSSSKSILKKEL